MTLVASDGYEYADLTARLLGHRLESARNRHIRDHRLKENPYGKYDEDTIRVFIKGYDSNWIRWNPLYWIANKAERSWIRVGQGRWAVICYWAKG